MEPTVLICDQTQTEKLTTARGAVGTLRDRRKSPNWRKIKVAVQIHIQVDRIYGFHTRNKHLGKATPFDIPTPKKRGGKTGGGCTHNRQEENGRGGEGGRVACSTTDEAKGCSSYFAAHACSEQENQASPLQGESGGGEEAKQREEQGGP